MSSDAYAPEPAPEPDAAPPPPDAPRFDAEPYRAGGSAPPVGTLLTFAGLVAAGAVVGLVMSVVHQWFYLVLVFPFLMGLVAGGVGVGLVKLFKMRSAPLAGLAAALAGLTTVAAMHYGDYHRFVGQMEQALPGLRAAMAERGVRFGFTDYLDMRATEGVTIGRPGRGNKGMNLGYAGSFVYWGVEALCVAGVAFGMLRAAAVAPFCAACGGWKQRRVVARLDTPYAEKAAEALREGELVRLLQGSWPVGEEGLHLKASACPRCGADAPVDVALEAHGKANKGQKVVKELAHVTYPGAALPFLDAPRGAS